MQMRQVLQKTNSDRSSIVSTAKLPGTRPVAAPLPIEETAPSITSSEFGNLLKTSTLLGSRQPSPSVQPKLTIGEPGDQYEQEADRVAAEVVQQMNAPADSRSLDESENSNKPIQRSLKSIAQRASQASSPPIQRYQEFHNHIRRQILTGDPDPQANFETRLNQARQGGSSLDKTLRTKVEPLMGADFSGVKIHTDAQADQLSRSIQAKAFTTGQDVFFRQGAYEPGSRGGQELIAHELTHVVQQRGERTSVQRAKHIIKDIIKGGRIYNFFSNFLHNLGMESRRSRQVEAIVYRHLLSHQDNRRIYLIGHSEGGQAIIQGTRLSSLIEYALFHLHNFKRTYEFDPIYGEGGQTQSSLLDEERMRYNLTRFLNENRWMFVVVTLGTPGNIIGTTHFNSLHITTDNDPITRIPRLLGARYDETVSNNGGHSYERGYRYRVEGIIRQALEEGAATYMAGGVLTSNEETILRLQEAKRKAREAA
jgi:hypothetical protein